MQLIYIAAPFTASTTWLVAENVRRAERHGLVVAECGGWPVIPHANTALFHGSVDAQDAYEGTMEMLRRCDGVLLAERTRHHDGLPSEGVAREIDEARRLGIPVLDMDGRELGTALGRGSITGWLRDVVPCKAGCCGPRGRAGMELDHEARRVAMSAAHNGGRA